MENILNLVICTQNFREENYYREMFYISTRERHKGIKLHYSSLNSRIFLSQESLIHVTDIIKKEIKKATEKKKKKEKTKRKKTVKKRKKKKLSKTKQSENIFLI